MRRTCRRCLSARRRRFADDIPRLHHHGHGRAGEGVRQGRLGAHPAVGQFLPAPAQSTASGSHLRILTAAGFIDCLCEFRRQCLDVRLQELIIVVAGHV